MRKIDHIGIAVRSLEEAIPFYVEHLGMRHVETEEVPTEQVRVAILDCAGTRIELLEPTSDDSVIAVFIQKRGPSVHHMAYVSEGIAKDVRDLEAKGVQLIQPAPRPGAGGCKVAFVHPKSTGGVLVELVERPR